jgi:hypothetical protein
MIVTHLNENAPSRAHTNRVVERCRYGSVESAVIDVSQQLDSRVLNSAFSLSLGILSYLGRYITY